MGTVGLVSAQQPTFNTVRDYLSQKIETNDLVGIYIGKVSAKGALKELTMGKLKVDGNDPVTKYSIFEIGSISKVFTTQLLADLMQKKKISLDDHAEQYLPDGMTLPTYKEQSITLRDLVTHTSGLPSFPDDLFPEDPSNPYADYTLEKLKQYLKGYKLTRVPGSRFEYSNMGMALIGHILENETGKEYEQLVASQIAEPLGMLNTGITVIPKNHARLARGHSGGKTVSNWDLPAFEAAGALRSNGNNMSKFLKAQMGLLDYEGYRDMKKTQEPLYSIKQGVNKQTDKIGMGWFYTEEKAPIIWHSGGTGGYRSFIGINQQEGTGVIVLSNSTADISDLYFHLLDKDYQLQEAETTISVTSQNLQRLIGKYKSEQGASFFVTQTGGELFIRLNGQNKNPVTAVAKNRFVNRQLGAEFTFDTTRSGEVSALTLRQAGHTIAAEKISGTVPKKTEQEIVEIEKSLLQRYIGTYKLTHNFSIRVVMQDGHLYAQASGQQNFRIYPKSETEFFYKAVDAELEFVNNAEGTFDRLVLYQGGRKMEGKRVPEYDTK